MTKRRLRIALPIVLLALAAPALAADPLPTFAVTVQPNTTDPAIPETGYNFWWNAGDSAVTARRGPNGDDRGRIVEVGGPNGQDEWWFALEWKWDPSFDRSGDWGRYFNFHNVAGDVGWSYGSGVSAVAFDYSPHRDLHQLTLQYDPTKHFPLPQPEHGVWQSMLVHVVFGRTDGTTARPGLVQVWLNGNDVPVVDAPNVNTLQRALNPATKEYQTQQWVQLWEGYYTRSLPETEKINLEHVIARAGTTVEGALADRPIRARAWGSVHDPSLGSNYGNSTSVVSTSRTTADFKVPPRFQTAADLGADGEVGAPAPPTASGEGS